MAKNYIHQLQDKVEAKELALDQVSEMLMEFSAHLMTDKFRGGNFPKNNWINCDDVAHRLADIASKVRAGKMAEDVEDLS